MRNFIPGKKAVSPVIGTILMVAVTVIMAAIVGGFVYQTGKPKIAPTLAASLEDDERVVLTNGTNNGRVARLTIEAGQSIAWSEVKVLVTYTGEDNVEYTGFAPSAGFVDIGNNVYNGPFDTGLALRLIDSDGSGDITPGDRFDLSETGPGGAGGEYGAAPNTDLTVKIVHKSTESTLVNQTIRVY